jgi:hypothetical protein
MKTSVKSRMDLTVDLGVEFAPGRGGELTDTPATGFLSSYFGRTFVRTHTAIFFSFTLHM